jgi:hypothetical protein
VKWLANELAARMKKTVSFTGEPAETGWLNNSAEAMRLLGYPQVPIKTMISWVADWVGNNRGSLNKPTKFENRDGKY